MASTNTGNNVQIIRLIIRQQGNSRSEEETTMRDFEVHERSFCPFTRLGVIGRNLEDLRFPYCIRMSAIQLEKLAGFIAPEMNKVLCNGEFIGVAECLFLTLRLLTSGNSHHIRHSHDLDNEQIETIVGSTTKAIYKALMPLVMYPDFSMLNWLKCEQDLKKVTDFPQCVGVVGGKHVMIRTPDYEEDYMESDINVFLAICDGNYMFNYIDINPYGDKDSMQIFKESFLGYRIMFREFKLPVAFPMTGSPSALKDLPYCFVADNSFPLHQNLMRPYRRLRRMEYKQRIFNNRLGLTQNVIENCFGVLACQWKIFSKPIDMSAPTVLWISRACACLHNWLRLSDLNNQSLISYMTPNSVDHVHNGVFVPGKWREVAKDYNGFKSMEEIQETHMTSSAEAFQLRDKFADFFVSEDGIVNWQRGIFRLSS